MNGENEITTKVTMLMYPDSIDGRYASFVYYGGLKFIPLGFERLVILQSVDKVKLNLSSCFSLANLTLVKHDYKFNFTLLTDCRITNLLNPRGTNFSPPKYVPANRIYENNYTLKHGNSVRINYVRNRTSELRDSPNHGGNNWK